MKYTPPIGGLSGAPYIDSNPAGGIEGSTVPAAAIEAPQREIDDVITQSGLVPDANNLAQLRQALTLIAIQDLGTAAFRAIGLAGTNVPEILLATGKLDASIVPSIGVDQVARNLTIINAWQIAMQGNIPAGTTADWVRINTFQTNNLPTSTGATYVIASKAYSSNQAYSADLSATGTAISSSDQPATVPAYATDDNLTTHWESGEVGAGVAGVAYLGVDFGVGNNKEIRRVGLRYKASIGWGPTSIKVQRLVGGVTWTDAAIINPVDDGIGSLQVFDLPVSSSDQQWRFLANSAVSGGGGMWFVEVELMPLLPATNMVLIDSAFVVPAVPLDGCAQILHAFKGAGVLNTDIKAFMARDATGLGGWVQGVLTVQDPFIADPTFNVLVAHFDLSILPAGSQPLLKVETYNTIEQTVGAFGVVVI